MGSPGAVANSGKARIQERQEPGVDCGDEQLSGRILGRPRLRLVLGSIGDRAGKTRTRHETDKAYPGRAAADATREGARPQRSSGASGGPTRRSSGFARLWKTLFCPREF